MSVQDFSLSYQKSPIILTGGIASEPAVPGGKLPIISITQSLYFTGGILSGAEDLPLDKFLFNFQPLPGATLVENKLGEYPFANQATAANAIISDPLVISMLMLAPVNTQGGYSQKLAVFQSLKRSLDLHNASGGTYTVVTPSYIYQDCILLTLRDVSTGDASTPQDRWQWDFRQPLVSLQAAQAAQNSLMRKISSGAPVTPNNKGEITYSGQPAALGNPASGVTPSVIPAAKSLAGASVGGQQSNRAASN